MDFEKGVPVAVNGEKMDAVKLLEKLQRNRAARNGVGIADMVENRLVGMKSRGVYETPGGTMLYAAHGNLEDIYLDRDTMHYKEQVAQQVCGAGVRRPCGITPAARGALRVCGQHPADGHRRR